MGKFVDLSGKRFGRLVVIDRADDYISPKGYHKAKWNCLCDCGNNAVVGAQELRSGDTKSCGCYEQETKRVNATTHGLSKTPLHSIWKGIKARCYNQNHKNYNDYGGRGISVCIEWKDSFKTFYDWAMKNGYRKGLTIDRVDVNGDYCPLNCRWVTRVVQANNRRSNININYKGKTHNLRWWAKFAKINYNTLYHRIKSGMDIETALFR